MRNKCARVDYCCYSNCSTVAMQVQVAILTPGFANKSFVLKLLLVLLTLKAIAVSSDSRVAKSVAALQ